MKKYHSHKILSICMALLLLLSSCSADAQSETDPVSKTTVVTSEGVVTKGSSSPIAEYSEFDLTAEAGENAYTVMLNGDTAECTSADVFVDDGILYICGAGDYILQGNFNNRIIIDAGSDDNVHLILNGITLSADMASLYVRTAKNVSLTLAEGSKNFIADSENYTFPEGEDEPNAAVFSKSDLTINGTGSLTVYGKYDCGIRSKDDLRIVDGNITLQSVGDAIKGRDSLQICGGNITVETGGDGLKSNNDEDASRGYVIIEGGNIDITAADDGIHAETWLQIYDGEITVHDSYEALEGMKIEIYGGYMDLSATDDGLNAASGSSSSAADDFEDRNFKREEMQFDFGGFFSREESMEMSEEGTMLEMPEEMTAPEGMTAPEMPDGMTFPDGMAAPEMPESMEEGGMNRGGKGQMGGGRGGMSDNFTGERPDDPSAVPNTSGDTISQEEPDAEVSRESKDGGFDWSTIFDGRGGGNRGGGGFFGGGGMMNEMSEDGVYILVAGGTIRVQAGVDILDSNGTFTQTGGTIITVGTSMAVYGSPEGVVDTNGTSVVESGTFISLARSAGSNADAFTDQPGFTYTVSSRDAAEETFTILDSAGNTVFSFVPHTASSVIFFTSDLLTAGESYTVDYAGETKDFTASEGIVSIK